MAFVSPIKKYATQKIIQINGLLNPGQQWRGFAGFLSVIPRQLWIIGRATRRSSIHAGFRVACSNFMHRAYEW